MTPAQLEEYENLTVKGSINAQKKYEDWEQVTNSCLGLTLEQYCFVLGGSGAMWGKTVWYW